MRILEQLGFDILPFDTTPFAAAATRFERSLASRANIGRGVSNLNAKLMVLAKDARFDVVWIDKGVWIYPETVTILRARSARRTAVHYTPDAQIFYNRSRYFLKSIPIYDLLVTTKPFEMESYRMHHANNLLLVLQGYGRQFTPRVPSKSDLSCFSSNVSFIGHCESHYVARMKIIHRETHIQIWGPRWPRYARFHPWARPFVRGEGIWGD